MVVNLAGCSIVAIGGGSANAPALSAELESATRSGIPRRSDRPIVVVAEVSANAGLIGAAAAGEVKFAA